MMEPWCFSGVSQHIKEKLSDELFPFMSTVIRFMHFHCENKNNYESTGYLGKTNFDSN